MKKLLILLLVLMLLLAGCQQNEPTVPTTESTPPTTTIPTTAPPTRPPVEVPEVEEVPVDEEIPFDYIECEELFGTWTLTVKIPSSYVNIPEFTENSSFPLIFTFLDDGRYTVTLEQKSYEAAIHQYENAVADFMIQSYYTKFVAEKKLGNNSDKKIKAQWEESGLSKAQQKTHGFLDQLALGATFGELVRSGYYYAEDGELFLSVDEGYESFQYKIDEEGLILSKSSRLGYYNRYFIYFPSVLKPQ